MIEVKQVNGRWRIKIVDEEWQFADEGELMEIAAQIIDLKAKYGQIK